TVDEERRCAVHAAPGAALEIVTDTREVAMRFEIRDEAGDVEPQGRGMCDEASRVERVLVLEEPVVHRPETTLCAGRLGCLGSDQRVRMHSDKRKMPEDERQPVGQ